MSHRNRWTIPHRSFNESFLLMLLLAGVVGLASIALPTVAVYVAPRSKAEEAFASAPNTPLPTPSPTATKCPSSRWLAEANAFDSVGSNHGMLKNGATFAGGVVGQAFSLNGLPNGAYVEIPINTPAMNSLGPLSSFTWEACINPTSLANNPVVFSKEAAGSISNRAGLQINTNGSLCSYMNSGNCAATTAAGLIPTNQFTKVTLLYNGLTNQLVTYVNGSQVGPAAPVLTPYNNTSPFNIGWSPSVPTTNFPGRIDEVIFSTCAVPPTACGCGPSPTPIP